MPINVRTLRDLNLSVSKALPAAAGTNDSASIDTNNINPGRLGDPETANPELLIEVPATPSLVDTKNVTVTLQDSDDNITFANSPDVPAQTTTGAGGGGGPAFRYQFKMPIKLRRYIRIEQTVDAAGGDNTAVSSSLSIVF